MFHFYLKIQGDTQEKLLDSTDGKVIDDDDDDDDDDDKKKPAKETKEKDAQKKADSKEKPEESDKEKSATPEEKIEQNGKDGAAEKPAVSAETPEETTTSTPSKEAPKVILRAWSLISKQYLHNCINFMTFNCDTKY